jgi:hypothetical protein
MIILRISYQKIYVFFFILLNKEIDLKELGLILEIGILLSLVKSLDSNLKLEEVLGDKGPSD